MFIITWQHAFLQLRAEVINVVIPLICICRLPYYES